MNAPMNLAAIQALANQAAQTGPNMTEAVKGGSGARDLPEGYAFGRLVEYIEFGQQPQEFGGVAKEPAMEIQLGFALTGEGYANPDGTPYVLRTWNMALSRNDKAKAFLLFKALNWKGTATHFAQLLGEAFLVKIYTHKPKDASKKASSAIDLKGFLPPLDPVNKAPYPIAPARDEDLRIFLWDYPDMSQWDALKIDGQTDDGKSKNFIQDKMIGAVDFSGSALEALLISGGKYNPPAKAATPAAPAMAAPAMPATPTAPPSAPAVPAATPPFDPPHQPTAPAVQAAAVPSTTPALPAMPTAPAMPSMPAMPALPVMP